MYGYDYLILSTIERAFSFYISRNPLRDKFIFDLFNISMFSLWTKNKIKTSFICSIVPEAGSEFLLQLSFSAVSRFSPLQLSPSSYWMQENLRKCLCHWRLSELSHRRLSESRNNLSEEGFSNNFRISE